MHTIKDEKLIFGIIVVMVLIAFAGLMIYGNFLQNSSVYFIKNLLVQNTVQFVVVVAWMVTAISALWMKQKTGRIVLAIASCLVAAIIFI